MGNTNAPPSPGWGGGLWPGGGLALIALNVKNPLVGGGG